MMDQAKLMELKVADCIPTGDNPRLVNEGSEKFRLLAASIKAEGVLEPVRVRPHPEKKGKYDLRDGARRHRAAELAGLKVIPALVYDNMTDQEAFELTFVPFFGREDLAPIEEAKAVSLYLEKCGGDTKVVADKLGQTERWVKLRANVFENLIRDWIVVVEENEDGDYDEWTISHLELVARFDRQTQQRLLEDRNMPYRPTVKQLDAWCNEQLRLLKNVPWTMDEDLPDDPGSAVTMVPCSTCWKRSSAEPLLFDFHKNADEDRCLDAVCFEQKKKAAIRKKVGEAKAHYPNLKLIAVAAKSERLDHGERTELREACPEVIFESLEAGKKTDPGSVPCMVLAGKSAGKVVWKKPAATSAAGDSPSSSRSRSGSAPQSPKQKTLKEKREELGKKRWQQVLKELYSLVTKCELDSIVHEDKASAIVLLAWQLGAGQAHMFSHHGKCRYGLEDIALVNTVMQVNADARNVVEFMEAVADLWTCFVRPRLLTLLSYCGPITQTPDDKIEAAGAIGKLLGIDVDALFEKACRDNPEPKSWSKPEPQKAKAKT